MAKSHPTFSAAILSGVAAVIAVFLMLFVTAGCEIEPLEPLQSGSVLVTLSVQDTAIAGATIRIDGRQTARLTPALIGGLSVGQHTISAFKPGFLDTAVVIQVERDQVTSAELRSARAEGGMIEIPAAPDGTTLLIGGTIAGIAPPAQFGPFGPGTFSVSAYLPDHATELPARWTVQLSAQSNVALSPLFARIPAGANAGNLAPSFELASDWDSTIYRLQDYRGHVVLLSFFFYNCVACIEEFPHIAATYEDPAYHGKVQFFGIDADDPYSVFADFRADHPTLGITFPLLHDRTQSVRRAYAVTRNPANFIIDQTGRLRAVRGGISEQELRQTIDQLLESASAPTFSFVMLDTLIEYTDGSRIYEFHGRVQNLLATERTLVFELNPVSFPDTARQASICDFTGCYPPRSGSQVVEELYAGGQLDAEIRYTIYNYISDWSQGFPLPLDSAISGDYAMDVVIYPADNAGERVRYRLNLRQIQAIQSAALRPARAVANRLR